MSASESSTPIPISCCNNNNGLLALANLAEIIIDCKEGNEQRYNTSSSKEETITSRITIMDETATTTPMVPLSTTTPASLPTSRRPAKKRAVPSTFNNNDDVAAAAANKRPKFIPPHQQQQQYNDDNTISCAIPRKRSFPMILMDILLSSSSSPSITFLSDGMSFIIINPVSLSRDVLSVYFKDYGNLITIGDFLQLLDVW